MMYSGERMKYIIEYISAYEQKIKISNKNGLLDNAKMFELFAEEVCKLYYNMNFHNLNNICNFPYFDLISEDESIYVQVSTTIDVHQKIKTTLENIRDDKEKRFSKLNNAYFFVLHNDSIKNIKDYTGENQIGNISFTKAQNLITTQDIINKAQNNLTFQEQLYNLIKTEFDNYNKWATKLENAIDSSINVGVNGIETKINNEYEIDRKELIEKIMEDNAKFISIQGREGVGKTVICKKLIENENMILYARAERFLEETHIEGIWNLDIKEILECLNGKKIIFFIDALEFIADASKTKLDLLESLYNIIQRYENAYIITSCRTSDKNAFIKIESKYNIVTYEVDEINKKELNLLKDKYPIIKKMSENKAYVDLLKTPFYINILVRDSIDMDEITDINKFREYIWKNIICLKDKQTKYNIKFKDVEDAVYKIVFDRARKFTLGVKEDDFDKNILYALKTEGIITFNSEGIRLKYDIYEDICFEMFLDIEYFECKGKYELFYQNIEKIGRCIYRRYQIWIANKLLAKDNRDKFLHNLIFNNEISDEWKKQTEVGIVKSNYNTSFFEEKEIEILEKNILIEFIDATNLYSYDVKIINNKDLCDVILVPVGVGRENIINIIEKNSIYSKDSIEKNKIIKLCLDYTNQMKQNENILNKVCKIMEYYIDESLKKENIRILNEINKCLIVVFKLSNYCIEWLNQFLDKLVEDYNTTDTKKKRIAEDIIKYIIENAYPQITRTHPERLCKIASLIWKEEKDDNNFYPTQYNPYELIDNYDFWYPNVTKNVFLLNIFRNNFWKGLDWAIKFVNECTERYAQNYPEEIIKINLCFVDEENKKREYYGNTNMWMGCTEGHHIHNLLSDIIYNIKEAMINYIDNNINDKEIFKYLDYIKSKIYNESNNVLLLTIIQNIGMHYQNEFLGYAIDLISSINIVEWDISRFITYLPNPQLEMLKRQIYQKVGIPNIENRYLEDKKCGISIEQYVQNIQLYGNKKIIDKCYKIFDYLYSIVKNDEENASKYLQIQKMDLRNAKITELDNNLISIEANITGEAKKLTDKHESNQIMDKNLVLKLSNCIKNLKEKKEKSEELEELIEEFIKIRKENEVKAIGLEKIIIYLITEALENKDISVEKKNDYCIYWVEGIEGILKNQNFEFEKTLISKLIKQLYIDIPIKTKNRIKAIVLNIINNSGYDGIINSIKVEIIEYLRRDKKLSNSIFNTIIELSRDEMKHQKYNARYIKDNDSEFTFIPNKTPRLNRTDLYVKQVKGKKYLSNKYNIINRYLYSANELKISQFNINDYDIRMLCNLSNCGKDFSDPLFYIIIKEIIKKITEIKNDDTIRYKMDVIDINSEYEIRDLFERELNLIDNEYERIIDMLFVDVDFSEFKNDSIEFYKEILNCFVIKYCNSYNDKKTRLAIEKRIKYIEQKIESIEIDNVRKKLYNCLYISPQKYIHWNPLNIITKYDYNDKIFLNQQLCKFGVYDLKNSIRTIYQLKINELLPEILISVEKILEFNKDNLYTEFEGDIRIIVNNIITKAFINFSDDIKKDDELISSYENILKILVNINYEKAGVLLDEFRIH